MGGMLLAYDADGNIVATRDFQVQYDPVTLMPLGLVDYLAVEAAGLDLSPTLWTVETVDWVDHPNGPRAVIRPRVKGSKVWPEWLGGRAHQFRVELEGDPGKKRIGALVHRASGHRRVRAEIEATVLEARLSALEVAARLGLPPEKFRVDVSRLVGRPDVPLSLDDEGRRVVPGRSERQALPLVPINKGKGKGNGR